MKVCHTQAMKMIKEYEEQKRILLMREDNYSQVSYKEGEKKIASDYNYNAVRKAFKKLDSEVRKMRAALAEANCRVVVDDFEITIGEALVMLAQMQSERQHLEGMANSVQLSRRLTQNGVIEYTECLFDVAKVKQDVSELRQKISNLQVAIDRANLTNYIEL